MTFHQPSLYGIRTIIRSLIMLKFFDVPLQNPLLAVDYIVLPLHDADETTSE